MSEFDLIKTYFSPTIRRAVLGGGDDCALLHPPSSTDLAISSDMLVSGQHFFEDVEPASLGHKVLAVNLSDLAACGAKPIAFTLAIALPEVNHHWLKSFSTGLLTLAEQSACELIGGDTTKGPLTLCITVLGEAPQNTAILRSGAQPGDDLYVSGSLGDARLGLLTKSNKLALRSQDQAFCIERLERPTPRIALGMALRRIATSAIDISDGLVGDLQHLLAASHVGASLDTTTLAHCMRTPEQHSLNQEDRIRHILTGGDDYELLFTAPVRHRALLSEISQACCTTLTRIGSINDSQQFSLTGPFQHLNVENISSFDHFYT